MKTPIMQLTEAGFQKLQKEYDNLVNNKRPAAVDRLSQARSMGDLSENSDYHQAKEQLEFIDGRIVELESVLSQALVVKGGHSTKEVGVGAIVGGKVGVAEGVFNNSASLVCTICVEKESKERRPLKNDEFITDELSVARYKLV